MLPPPWYQLLGLLWATEEKHWGSKGRGAMGNRKVRGGGNSKKKKKSRLRKDTSPVWVVWDLFKTSEFRECQAIGKIFLLVATHEWCLCIKLALQSLQIHPQRPPNTSRKREAQRPSTHF